MQENIVVIAKYRARIESLTQEIQKLTAGVPVPMEEEEQPPPQQQRQQQEGPCQQAVQQEEGGGGVWM